MMLIGLYEAIRFSSLYIAIRFGSLSILGLFLTFFMKMACFSNKNDSVVSVFVW